MTKIARCPRHGLHGERSECFVCGGEVEQVRMVEAPSFRALLALWAAALLAEAALLLFASAIPGGLSLGTGVVVLGGVAAINGLLAFGAWRAS